jgi:hypothetical protein
MRKRLYSVWYCCNGVVPAKAGIQKGKLFNPHGLLGSRLRGLPKVHEGVYLAQYVCTNVVPAKAGIQKGKLFNPKGLLGSRLRGKDRK